MFQDLLNKVLGKKEEAPPEQPDQAGDQVVVPEEKHGEETPEHAALLEIVSHLDELSEHVDGKIVQVDNKIKEFETKYDVSKELEEIRGKISSVEKTLDEFSAVYEVISNQYNPFVEGQDAPKQETPTELQEEVPKENLPSESVQETPETKEPQEPAGVSEISEDEEKLIEKPSEKEEIENHAEETQQVEPEQKEEPVELMGEQGKLVETTEGKETTDEERGKENEFKDTPAVEPKVTPEENEPEEQHPTSEEHKRQLLEEGQQERERVDNVDHIHVEDSLTKDVKKVSVGSLRVGGSIEVEGAKGTEGDAKQLTISTEEPQTVLQAFHQLTGLNEDLKRKILQELLAEKEHDTHLRVSTTEKFHLAHREPLSSIYDLASVLVGHPEIFQEHVGPRKDHFADWIEHTAGNPNIAQKLRTIKDMHEYVLTLLYMELPR